MSVLCVHVVYKCVMSGCVVGVHDVYTCVMGGHVGCVFGALLMVHLLTRMANGGGST